MRVPAPPSTLAVLAALACSGEDPVSTPPPEDAPAFISYGAPAEPR